MRIKFWLQNLKGIYHSKELGFDEKIIFQCKLGKYGLGIRIEFIWLVTQTAGRLL
jgi:hypothetical protein